MISKLSYKYVLLHLMLINSSFGFLEGLWESQSQSYLPNNETNFPATLSSDPNEKEAVLDDNSFNVTYTLSGNITKCVTLEMKSVPKKITNLSNSQTLCPRNVSSEASYLYQFSIERHGIVTIEIEALPWDVIDTQDAFVSLSVALNPALNTISDVMGWIYTIAWDMSFLPQIVHNWSRHSVVGLSFDFLTFNFIGFFCYSFFNMGLYWIEGIQDQYYEKNPTSLLHVRLNDVIFPLYAVLCTTVQIIQCLFYERGNQRVSTTCRIISAIMIVSIAIYAILVGTVEHILWLNFLYWLSYIKLAVTCIKYAPQLYINYKHKSTEGWSIWQVFLDFTGGALSLFQMFLLAYNYDDYHSVLTDPSKLGLGLLSIIFNIFFFIQHYCLYRNNNIVDPEEAEIKEKEKTITTKF